MKQLQASPNKECWPCCETKAVECRKRDLVIRVSDWTRQSIETGEPAYDVECYIGGIYDWNESKTFTLHSGLTKKQAKQKAIEYAQAQIARLL